MGHAQLSLNCSDAAFLLRLYPSFGPYSAHKRGCQLRYCAARALRIVFPRGSCAGCHWLLWSMFARTQRTLHAATNHHYILMKYHTRFVHATGLIKRDYVSRSSRMIIACGCSVRHVSGCARVGWVGSATGNRRATLIVE